MLKILYIAIAFIALSYLAFILFMFLRQKQMIFRPSGNIIGDPSDLGLEFQDAYFTSSKGSRLNGWFIPADNAEYTVLFCHGNGGNISYRLDTISLLNDIPVNFFIFDYSSYGKSSGDISEEALHADAFAAWQYLTEERGIAPDKIVILGRSLGGAVASHLAANVATPAKGLILESTFTSIPDIVKKTIPFVPLFLLKYRLSTIDELKKTRCPVLIIASPDDTIVPYCFSEQLFEAAHEPRTFVQLTGEHDDCYFLCRAKYIGALRKFLNSENK